MTIHRQTSRPRSTSDGRVAATLTGSLTGRRVGGRRSVREQQVEAIWDVELSRPGAGLAGDPVLPHQCPGGRVDRDHAVVVVVVGHDDAAWQQFGERGMVEPPRPRGLVAAVARLPRASTTAQTLP